MNGSEEEWREALRRRLSAGQTIAGRPTPAWLRAPLQAVELSPLPEAMRSRMRQPKGPLQAVLGSRILSKDLLDEEFGDEQDLSVLGRVTAYEVPVLHGAEFEVEAVADIPTQLRAVLARLLPGIDWWVPTHWEGPFLKYGILHNSLPAPPNEATGEAMALELYGQADQAVPPGSDDWAAARLRWVQDGAKPEEEPQGVHFPTRVRISVATYANIAFPGYRVPLYM